MQKLLLGWLLAVMTVAGCNGGGTVDAGTDGAPAMDVQVDGRDASFVDMGLDTLAAPDVVVDAAIDAAIDAGAADVAPDGTTSDTVSVTDVGTDVTSTDASVDVSTDAQVDVSIMTDSNPTDVTLLPGECIDASVCASGQYCEVTGGSGIEACGTVGMCVSAPSVCPMFQVGGGVCGCNGHWYGNPCKAHRDGHTRATRQLAVGETCP